MNMFKTCLLMSALFGLFMVIGQVFGGRSGIIIGFTFAFCSNFFMYWFSDKIALAMGGAHEVSEMEAPQLYQTVRNLAQRAGLPMPRVYIVNSQVPNAFATGRNPSHAAVAVHEGLMQVLSQEELEGVLAHELAHVKNRDILISTIAATVAGAIGMAGMMIRYAMMFGGYGRNDRDDGENPFVLLAMAILAPLAAMLIQLGISRSREYEADRIGAHICGRPLALASALKRIENYAERMPLDVNPSTAHMYIINPLGGDKLKSLSALFRTHPLTEDRIAKLEQVAVEMGQY